MLEQIYALGDCERSPTVCELLVNAQIFGGSLWPTIWLSREGRAGTPLSGTPGIEWGLAVGVSAGPDSRIRS